MKSSRNVAPFHLFNGPCSKRKTQSTSTGLSGRAFSVYQDKMVLQKNLECFQCLETTNEDTDAWKLLSHFQHLL